MSKRCNPEGHGPRAKQSDVRLGTRAPAFHNDCKHHAIRRSRTSWRVGVYVDLPPNGCSINKNGSRHNNRKVKHVMRNPLNDEFVL